MTEHAAEKQGFETSDISPRLIAMSGAILAAGAVVCLCTVAGLLAWLGRGQSPSIQSPAPTQTAGLKAPTLETDPAANRIAEEAAAKRRLAGYGWVDRQKGVVHIPIEEAMRLQAAKGWPDPEQAP